MMATGVLKGFGLSAQQIAKAQSIWAAKSEETKEQRDARMKWWHEAKFGMFIHWGVYSVPAGTYDGKQIGGIGEWIMNRGKIPVAEYAEFAKEFNPVKFNAESGSRSPRTPGMKYIVITSKHHDGFAMFHSQGQPVQHLRRHALQTRPAGGIGRGVPQGRHQARVLLFAEPRLAPSGRRRRRRPLGQGARRRLRPSTSTRSPCRRCKKSFRNYGEFPAVLWFDTSGHDQQGKRGEALQAGQGAEAEHHHQ